MDARDRPSPADTSAGASPARAPEYLAHPARGSHGHIGGALSADTQDLIPTRAFNERFPERFIEVSIAEQNVIGVAAGLATAGPFPVVCGYAPFFTACSKEQVCNAELLALERPTRTQMLGIRARGWASRPPARS